MSDNAILKRLESIELEISRLKAQNEICNLMAHYEVLHNQKNMMLHPMDFAMTMPDVSVQVGESQVYSGPEGVNKLFCSDYEVKDCAGIMLIHYLTTQYIEVAGDGRTARGLWWTPGIETVIKDKKKGPEAVWCFGSYANDFILENGVWKIWHLRFARVAKCSYAEGWVDQKVEYVSTASAAKERPVLHNPYSVNYTQESIPMGPKPYDTWNDDAWYLDQEK